MGSTGVGKSAVRFPLLNDFCPSRSLQFVNAAANMDATTVSHDLESCTKEISIVPIPFSENPTRRVILVDTPGFDDTWLPDTEILRRIAEWLERS